MLALSTDDPVYAGFLPRGFAYLIDCAVVFVLFAATQLLIFTPAREAVGIGWDWFQSGLHTQLYTLATISLPAWLYFALCEGSSWRATVGKRLVKLRVGLGAQEGARIRFSRALARTIVKLLPWELAHLTHNLPTPMLLVEEPGFRLGFIAVGVLMGLYVASVLLHKKKQGPHDLIAGTVVVREAALKY